MALKAMRSDEMTKGESRDREEDKAEPWSFPMKNQEAEKELKKVLKSSHAIGENSEQCGVLEMNEENVLRRSG